MLSKAITGLLIATVTGIVGWGLGISQTVAQQESMISALADHVNTVTSHEDEALEDIKQRLNRIQGDITEIRRELREERRK